MTAMLLDTPTEMWKFMNEGRCVIRAYPSAMPAATPSKSEVTYWMSGASCKASRKGSSVVPGFPKTYRTPSARSISTSARCPVILGITSSHAKIHSWYILA